MASPSPESAIVDNHTVEKSAVLYAVKVTSNGETHEVVKRYSDFAALQQALRGAHAIPPKRILVTMFVPSAWVDARLIKERKAGFNTYLAAVLTDPALKDDARVLEFLAAPSVTPASASEEPAFHPEDALPSKFTREMTVAYLEGAVESEELVDIKNDDETIAPAVEAEEAPAVPAKEEIAVAAKEPVAAVAEEATPTEAAIEPLFEVVESAFVEDLQEDDDAFEAAAVPVANPLACAYYPDWSSGGNPPDKVDFSKFDILFFAFVTTNVKGELHWGNGSQAILKKLVAAAKKSGKGTKVVLSVGGWAGSASFSESMATAAHRTKFVKSLASAVSSYKLDGVDIDWEYPNAPGAGNKFTPEDSDHLLLFLKALRSKLGATKLITSAVPHNPWNGSNGKPLTDVSAFAAVMSFVNIMNYDVWGASSKPGPNAPVSNKCGDSALPQSNAKGALAAWTKAGFPAKQLLLGLPTYGYVSKSKATRLSSAGPGFAAEDDDEAVESPVETEPEAEVEPKAEALVEEVAPAEVVEDKKEVVEEDTVPLSEAEAKEETPAPISDRAHTMPKPADISFVDALAAGDLSVYWNTQVAFKTLVTAGALVKGADGKYVGANGFTRGWDNCSDTPYLYNVSCSTVVTYDDNDSTRIKAAFAQKNGMAGCFTWSLDQDDEYTLQSSLRKGMGKN